MNGYRNGTPVTTEYLSALRGNETLKRYLVSELEAGKLSHAYLFEGPKGSGKFTLALAIAATMSPASAHKIYGVGCVDVHVYAIPEDKKTISVDTVREIKEQASILPQELPHQIFIIRDAQAMTPAAQNSFLKILEEPPEGVYFFLLCDNASALLPTVRSRAPLMRMQTFDEEELTAIAVETEKKAAELQRRAPDELALLIRSAGGTVGGLLDKLGERKDARNAIREKAAILVGLLRDGDRAGLWIFFSTLPLQRDETATLLGYLGEAARDLMAVKKTSGARLLFYLSREKAEEDAFSFATDSLMKLYEATDTLIGELKTNVGQAVFNIHCIHVLTDAVK